MKNNVIRIFSAGVLLSGITLLQNCKKDTQLSEIPKQKMNVLASAAADSLTSPYVVSTLIGRDPVTKAPKITNPFSICSAADGSMYVSTYYPGKIYKISPKGTYSTYLTFSDPFGIRAGANGSVYFMSRYSTLDGSIDTNAVIKVDKNKNITALPIAEHLTQILDLAIAPDSSIYVPDYLNNRIIKFTKEGVTSILAGKMGVRGYADGQGEKAHFTNPTYVKFGEDGNLWVVDGRNNSIGQSIRKISMQGNVTTVYVLKPNYKNLTYIESFAVTKRDKDFNLSPYENVVFFVRSFTDSVSHGTRVAKNQLFHLSHDNVLTPITGNMPEDYYYKDGPASQANFNLPSGITVNTNGIFIADSQNWVIRKIAKQ